MKSKIFVLFIIMTVLIGSPVLAQDSDTVTIQLDGGMYHRWHLIENQSALVHYYSPPAEDALVYSYSENWGLANHKLGNYLGVVLDTENTEQAFVFEHWSIAIRGDDSEFVQQETLFLDDSCMVILVEDGTLLRIVNLTDEEFACDGLQFTVTNED